MRYLAKGIGLPRKGLICLVGLVTGILLFTGSFSLLLENTFFHSSFYKSAFEKLGTYEKIAELAGIPARELTERISEPSSSQMDLSGQISIDGTEQQKTMIQALVEDNVSDSMVRWNVDSLVDGLMRFFRGETDLLPDLHLTGSPLFENINLQILIMYMGESRISDIFRLICLVQYTLAHIPLLVVLLLPLFASVMLSGTAEESILWIRTTACSLWIACSTAAFAFLFAPGYVVTAAMTRFGTAPADMTSLILLHTGYLFGILAFMAFLTGIVPLAVSELINRFYQNATRAYSTHIKNGQAGKSPNLEFPSMRRFAFAMAVMLLFGSATDIILVSSFQEFDRRNLGQSLSLLWNNNPLYHVTNARSDLVYLLTVHIADKEFNEPLSNIGIAIVPESGSESSFQEFFGVTDRNGNTTFFLNKGEYSLILDSNNRFADSSKDQAGIWRFSMESPGKSIIHTVLEQRNGAMPRISDMAFQFMP